MIFKDFKFHDQFCSWFPGEVIEIFLKFVGRRHHYFRQKLHIVQKFLNDMASQFFSFQNNEKFRYINFNVSTKFTGFTKKNPGNYIIFVIYAKGGPNF
jgi:hypothetical protein